MEEQEKGWFSKIKGVILLILLLAIPVGLLLGVGYLKDKDNREILEKLDKKAPAITQQSFEDLPVGLIYEYSEEDKAEFLEMAKDPEFSAGQFFQETVELTLAEDGSLRRPEGFIGRLETNLDGKSKYESEDMTEHLVLDKMIESRFDANGLDIDKVVNRILHYEEYWNNGGKVSVNFSGWKWLIDSNYTSLYDDFYGDEIMKRAMDSEFLKTDVGVNHLPYEFMFFGPLIRNPYYMLMEAANNQPDDNYLSVQFNGLSSKLEKYNEADKYSGTVTTYYFPTKVWKLDDKHIIVDVQIENGSMLSTLDINKLVSKINYANAEVVDQEDTEGQEAFMVNGTYDPETDFTVSARYFDSDITQGFRPDFGMSIANRYQGYGANFNTGHFRKDIVLNEQAKELLKDYYKEINRCMENNETISTLNILKELASKHNMSHEEAVNIWAVNYMQGTVHAMSLANYLKNNF